MHTSGPWKYSFDGHGGISIDNDQGIQIGFVSRGNEDNARVVAAAPDMLAALFEAYEQVSGRTKTLVEAAIDKATRG